MKISLPTLLKHGPLGLAGTIGKAALPQGLTPEKDAKLRKASQQMEGSFVQQMYKVMRDTAPNDGIMGGGSGEDMFTGLLDEHVAADTPTKWHHSLSDSIYRQMREKVQGQSHTNASTNTPASSPEPTAQTVVSNAEY